MAMEQQNLTDKKVWTKEEIKVMLENNPKAVLRGVLAIYEYQTSFEKAQQTTAEDNGVGFSGADAGILSSFAEQLLRGRQLSGKQYALAAKKILKYAGQLAKIANAKSSRA